MSKHCDAVCAITSVGPIDREVSLLSMLLSMPPSVTIAPFGTPVDPEV